MWDFFIFPSGLSRLFFVTWRLRTFNNRLVVQRKESVYLHRFLLFFFVLFSFFFLDADDHHHQQQQQQQQQMLKDEQQQNNMMYGGLGATSLIDHDNRPHSNISTEAATATSYIGLAAGSYPTTPLYTSTSSLLTSQVSSYDRNDRSSPIPSGP